MSITIQNWVSSSGSAAAIRRDRQSTDDRPPAQASYFDLKTRRGGPRLLPRIDPGRMVGDYGSAGSGQGYDVGGSRRWGEEIPMAVASLSPGRRSRGRALRIAVASLCVLAVVSTGAGTASAGRGTGGGPEVTWSKPATIPAAKTGQGSPALAVYHGLLYAAWEGRSSPYHIWYSAFDGSTHKWSAAAKVPNALTNGSDGPSLSVYGGRLYAFWAGQSPGSSCTSSALPCYHIWYSAFNGKHWTKKAEVRAALTSFLVSVGLAAYGGDLYLTWEGWKEEGLWYDVFNGKRWTGQARVPSTSSACRTSAPLASYRSVLYLAWGQCNPTNLVYAAFKRSWHFQASTPFTAVLNPALAVQGSDLYAAWTVALVPCQVDWASFNGTSWTGGSAIPSAEEGESAGPAVASYHGALYVAWDVTAKGCGVGGTATIEYSILS
jgi:hypothetical protein